MERALLVIVLIVTLVGIVSLFSRYPIAEGSDALASGLTGNVVAGDCSSCAGYAPVCARLNHWLLTFPNECEARCQGAVVVADRSCQQLPTS